MSKNWSPGAGQPDKHDPYEPQGEKFHDHPLDHPALNHREPEQVGPEPVQHLWSDHVDTIICACPPGHW